MTDDLFDEFNAQFNSEKAYTPLTKSEYKITPIVLSVHRGKENPIFGEGATHVILEDEAAGYFIKLKQVRDDSEQGVFLDVEELPIIVKAVNQLIKGTE